MSLAVSLRVPDGIVTAADSLSTAQTVVEMVPQIEPFTCPSCGAAVETGKIQVPPIAFPFSASSYTQKLFPLKNKFAIASVGAGVVNKRSIYCHLKQFETSVADEPDLTLSKVRDKLVDHFES